jgi:hypothetical protein
MNDISRHYCNSKTLAMAPDETAMRAQLAAWLTTAYDHVASLKSTLAARRGDLAKLAAFADESRERRAALATEAKSVLANLASADARFAVLMGGIGSDSEADAKFFEGASGLRRLEQVWEDAHTKLAGVEGTSRESVACRIFFEFEFFFFFFFFLGLNF